MAVELRTALGVWLAAWLLIQVVVALLLAVGGFPLDVAEMPLGGLVAVFVVGWAIWVVALWYAAEGRRGREPSEGWRAAYGARWRPIDAVGLAVGGLLQFVVPLVVYTPLRAIWPGVFSEDAVNEFAENLFDRATSPLSLVVLVAIVVVGAPVIEEFVYRGLLQRSLATRLSPWLAVVAVAVVFALIHARPIEYPGLFVVGVCFGAALVLTGRIATAIAVHMGFNLAAVLVIWPI